MPSPIPDHYNPVAYSAAENIINWHTNNSTWSYFMFANFIIFPVMTMVLIIASMVYYRKQSGEDQRDNNEPQDRVSEMGPAE